MDLNDLIPPRKAPAAPSGLRRGGDARKLWASLLGLYQLRPDEHALFVAAVRTTDELDRMRRELPETLTMRGARGSIGAHPLLGEIRKHEAVLIKLLGALGLEEADGTEASQAGVTLVRKRWARRGG